MSPLRLQPTTGERIPLEGLAHHAAETVEALPEVRRLHGDENAHAVGQHQHARPSRTATRSTSAKSPLGLHPGPIPWAYTLPL